jgi:hypothetical protein
VELFAAEGIPELTYLLTHLFEMGNDFVFARVNICPPTIVFGRLDPDLPINSR